MEKIAKLLTMNKKHKTGNTIIKCLIIILAIFCISANIFAEENPQSSATSEEEIQPGSPGDESEEDRRNDIYINTCNEDFSTDEERNECVDAAKKCYTELTTSNFKLTVEPSHDNKNFEIKLVNSTSKKVKFLLKYKIYTNGNLTADQSAEIEIAKNTTKKITPSTGWDERSNNNNVQIQVTAKLLSGVSANVRTTSGNNVNCSGRYIASANSEITKTTVDEFDNPDYYEVSTGLCFKYMHNGLTLADTGEAYKALLSTHAYAKTLPDLTEEQANIRDAEFKKALPYCFNKKIVNKDNNLLKKFYNYANVYKDIKSNSLNVNVNEIPDGFKLIDENAIKNPINLTCDAFGRFDESLGRYVSENNVRKFSHIYDNSPEPIYYDYNYNNPTPVDVCTVKCREDLTITYGPPVSVQAGSCFEYEVKVESKVTCEAKFNENGAPNYKQYQVCNPVPYCNNGHWEYIHQAGPNEDFDECVKETDGGKYTQKAINKCYKKVYGNKKNKSKMNSALALDYSNVQRMNSTSAICQKNRAYSEAEARELYREYTSGGKYGGYYKIENGTLKWVKYGSGQYYSDEKQENLIPTLGECYWNGYARFYFNNLSRAIRTVGNDQYNTNRWNHEAYDDLNKWTYHASEGRNNVPAGIKDGYNNYVRKECDDHCWYSYSCESAGTYYNQVAPWGEVGENKTSHMSAEAAYNADYEEYLAAITDCKAAAECSTETSTYKMVVDKLSGETDICEPTSTAGSEENDSCASWTDTKQKGGDKTCKYNLKNSTKNGVTTELIYDADGNSTRIPKSNLEDCAEVGNPDQTLVREISGVCTHVPGDSQDYRTIIGFPGTWIKSKSLTYRHKKPENTKNYVFRPNEYCVGTTIDTVNKDWYDWDMNLRPQDTSSVETTSELDGAGEKITKINGKLDKYNIKAFIETFGQSNWKFNIKCFYAAVNDECTPGDKDCPNPKDYDTKIITLDELFPSTESTSGVKNDNLKEIKPSKLNNSKTKENNVLKVENSQTAGRTPGFNWSCDATSLLIPDYPITPTALIAKIQTKYDKASDVYKDNSEVDFKLTLTPENIKNIRKNNKAREKAGEDPYITDVNSEEFYQNDKNNINFYESKLLQNKDANYVTSFEGPQEHTCNNMLNGKCDNYTDYYNISTCSKLNGGE